MPKRAVRRHWQPKKNRGFWWGILLILLSGVVLVGYSQVKTSIFLFKNQPVTLVFQTEPLIVLSLAQTSAARSIILTLPQDAYVDVPYGYGRYRLGAVWRLSELEQNPALVADTITDLLAIKIDGYLSWKNDLVVPKDKPNLVQYLTNSFGLPLVFSRSLRTNLNFLDRILLTFKLLALKTEVFIYRLDQEPNIVSQISLPDGTYALAIDENSLDKFLEQKLTDPQWHAEGLTIEIQNTTATLKAGQKFARFLTRVGGQVLSIRNAEAEVVNCEIVTANAWKNSKTVRLLESFGCSTSLQQEDETLDIIVKVGNKWGDRWRGISPSN